MGFERFHTLQCSIKYYASQSQLNKVTTDSFVVDFTFTAFDL